jgi:hypothetical protein
MSLKLKRKKTQKAPPMPAGTYTAICVGVIDIGEQHNTKYNNYQDKVMLIFEIPSETIEINGEKKPRWLSQELSASLNEKSKLYKMLRSWRAKDFTDAELEGFQLSEMAGKGCMIAVTLTEKDGVQYNNIDSVMGLPAGIPLPALQNDILIYDIDDPDQDIFDKIPPWIQDKIKKSTQYQKNLPEEKMDIPKTDEPNGGDCPI